MVTHQYSPLYLISTRILDKTRRDDTAGTVMKCKYLPPHTRPLCKPLHATKHSPLYPSKSMPSHCNWH